MASNQQLQKLKGRKLKSKVFDNLQLDDWQNTITELIAIQKTTIVSALFSLVYNPNPLIKWRAVTSFGILTEILSKAETDKIRIIIRRCIWMLTEESGGIPWGIPEVIGEILANNEQLAKEFDKILLSYVYESDGPENYLEHTPLRQGVYWGIYRLSLSFPQRVKDFQYIIEQRITIENEALIVAYLLMIIANSSMDNLYSYANKFIEDKRKVEIFINKGFVKIDIANIANQLKV